MSSHTIVEASDNAGRQRTPASAAAGILLIVVAVGLLPWFVDSYTLHLGILAGIAVVLASSLNLITGYTGKLSLGHAAFYGIGAYASTLLNLRLGVPVILAMACAGPCAALTAFVVGPIMLRLRGAHFIIVTLSFAIVLQLVFVNWVWLTNGPTGIFGIDYPKLGAFEFSSKESYFYLVAGFACLTIFAIWRVIHSRTGRAFIALREHEQLAMSIGISSRAYSLWAFTIAGAFAGWAGALYAHYVGVITPDLLGFDVMVATLVMLVIGGKGTLFGPVIGAVIVTYLPEQLRVLSEYRLTIFGIALMACVLLLPNGIISLRERVMRKGSEA